MRTPTDRRVLANLKTGLLRLPPKTLAPTERSASWLEAPAGAAPQGEQRLQRPRSAAPRRHRHWAAHEPWISGLSHYSTRPYPAQTTAANQPPGRRGVAFGGGAYPRSLTTILLLSAPVYQPATSLPWPYRTLASTSTTTGARSGFASAPLYANGGQMGLLQAMPPSGAATSTRRYCSSPRRR